MMKYPIPQNKKRGCLCRDGQTYSVECCGGDYFNQGVGSVTGLTLNNENVTFTGLSVSNQGVITPPSATYEGTDIGTVTVSPSSFSTVGTPTNRTVESTVTVPDSVQVSGEQVRFANAGSKVNKSEVVSQPALTTTTIAPTTTAAPTTTVAPTTTASPTTTVAGVTNTIESSIHKYTHTGVPSGIVTYRMAINPDGTFADFTGIRGSVVTLVSFLGYSEPEVVSGSSSGLSFSSTNVGGTTVGIGHHITTGVSYFSATEFSSLQTGTANNPNGTTASFTNNNGNTSSPTDFGLFDSVNSIGIRVVIPANQTDTSAPLSSQGSLNAAYVDGYYTNFNLNSQFRIQSGLITEVKNIV